MSNQIDYIAAGQEAEKKLLVLYQDTGNWTETKKTDGIIVYSKKSKEVGSFIYKTELTLNGNLDVAFHVWLPTPLGTRMEWDTQLESCDVVKNFDQDTIILRTVCKSIAMGMISSREFVDIVKLSNNSETKTASSSSFSIEFSEYPVQSKWVRGKNYASGAFFKTSSEDENKCEMTFIVHSDIGGMLPTALVDSAIPGNIVKSMQLFRAAVAKKTTL